MVFSVTSSGRGARCCLAGELGAALPEPLSIAAHACSPAPLCSNYNVTAKYILMLYRVLHNVMEFIQQTPQTGIEVRIIQTVTTDHKQIGSGNLTFQDLPDTLGNLDRSTPIQILL